MPFLNPEKQRAYARTWTAKRRAEWLADKACVACGATEQLEVDHIDPTAKSSHRIWSWTKARRDAELAKCQVLCAHCHREKTREQIRSKALCGTRARYVRGCRCEECRRANRTYVRPIRDGCVAPACVAPGLCRRSFECVARRP